MTTNEPTTKRTTMQTVNLPKTQAKPQTKPPQTVQMTKAEPLPERQQTIERHSPKTALHSIWQKKTARPQTIEPQTNSRVQFSQKTKTALQVRKPTISPPKKAVQKTQPEPWPLTIPPSKQNLPAEHPETVHRQKEIHTS